MRDIKCYYVGKTRNKATALNKVLTGRWVTLSSMTAAELKSYIEHLEKTVKFDNWDESYGVLYVKTNIGDYIYYKETYNIEALKNVVQELRRNI